jgi:hypothetical protein
MYILFVMKLRQQRTRGYSKPLLEAQVLQRSYVRSRSSWNNTMISKVRGPQSKNTVSGNISYCVVPDDKELKQKFEKGSCTRCDIETNKAHKRMKV